jgi:hypothetical protein
VLHSLDAIHIFHTDVENEDIELFVLVIGGGQFFAGVEFGYLNAEFFM